MHILARSLGVLLFAVGVAGIIYLKPKPEKILPDETIRPVKSLVAQKNFCAPELTFPGIVEENAGVDLSFQVSGQLIEFPYERARGTRVKKGALLARLDPRNFENELKNAEAEALRCKSTLDRYRRVSAAALSQEDRSRAQSDYDKAVAQLAIRRKALEDTQLLASFDGIVSDTYTENYSSIVAGKPVLTLQDVSSVRIRVAVPEKYVITANPKTSPARKFHVVFDALPGKSFPLTFVEFKTQADIKLQTYNATFQLPPDTGLLLLPGMSGTVVCEGMNATAATEKHLALPSDIIGQTSDGKAFVWLLKPETNNLFTVEQRLVELGARAGDTVEILDGLAAGDRLAAAGISLLQAGRRVTLLAGKTVKEAE